MSDSGTLDLGIEVFAGGSGSHKAHGSNKVLADRLHRSRSSLPKSVWIAIAAFCALVLLIALIVGITSSMGESEPAQPQYRDTSGFAAPCEVAIDGHDAPASGRSYRAI
jgi:hypothetical protein